MQTLSALRDADTTKAKGERLGLTGVAYNLADKRVEIVAEGPKAAIETLVEWCWKGPGVAPHFLTARLHARPHRFSRPVPRRGGS